MVVVKQKYFLEYVICDYLLKQEGVWTYLDAKCYQWLRMPSSTGHSKLFQQVQVANEAGPQMLNLVYFKRMSTSFLKFYNFFSIPSFLSAHSMKCTNMSS